MKKILLVAIILLGNTAFANCQTSNLQKIYNLIVQRASLMKSVAAYKWYYSPAHQASAYNAEQEIRVLNNVALLAKQMQLNPASLMVFAQIQMDLSKQIEAYWIQKWNNPTTPNKLKPTKATVRSLKVLRHSIINIDDKLFPLLKNNLANLHQCSEKQMQLQLHHSLNKIEGIPNQVNYINMFTQALKQIDNSKSAKMRR